MTIVTIPFLLSMLLGRTIDLTTYTIGGEIYDFIEYDENPRYEFNSTYTVLQENVLPYSHIGLPADIVLRIKSDDLHSSSGNLGLDGLLKKTSWKSNSVVIAVISVVQTVVRELKQNATLLDRWSTRIDSNQTHYVHAQVYGGWSIILYRFKCENNGQEEEVRKILTSVMGVSGPMDEKAVDLWQKATAILNQKEDLKDKINVEVQVYSSTSHSEPISSSDSILEAVKKFPEDIGSLGQPLFVKLKPLHDLNHNFSFVSPGNVQEEFYLKLDEMYDDVRSTKESIRKWMSGTATDFTEEEEGRISNLFDHVSRCANLFRSIAREASVYKPMDRGLYDSAYYLYKKGLNQKKCRGESYRHRFLELREDIDPDCGDDFSNKTAGFLEVWDDEQIEAGEMRDGLEGCMARCLQEPKCRSIRYTEKQPVEETDPQNSANPIFTFKPKQCWLQFRSSRTARVDTARFSNSAIYDRNCLRSNFQ